MEFDEDCRQAEEPKQLADEASRFHLGRERQHSAVICSGALLFSSRVILTQVRSMDEIKPCVFNYCCLSKGVDF